VGASYRRGGKEEAVPVEEGETRRPSSIQSHPEVVAGGARRRAARRPSDGARASGAGGRR
jgi:hypothetical protein